MANNNPNYEFRLISGQMETGEPAASTAATASTAGQSSRRSPSQQRQASSASTSGQTTPVPQLRKQRSSNLASLSPSAGNSPQTSRNNSPIRRDSRPQSLAAQISTQPSAAAIQRALSAANVPSLQSSGPVTEAVSRLPRASKSAGGVGSGDTTPQWPLSPRLKSPPPSATSARKGSAIALPKKAEQSSAGAAPSINVSAPSPGNSTPPPKPGMDESKRTEQQLQPPPKAPSRGPSGKSMLETVQENSADAISEPSAAVQAAADLKPLTRISEEDRPASKKEGPDAEKHTQPGESGSESAGSKAEQKRGRRSSVTQPPAAPSRSSTTIRNSYAPLHSAKSRQAEGRQNMTVETETVASIPQSGLTAGDRSASRNDPSGSIRLKPSNETIRPKKERKKPSQKARSINQGTASSKADIFEARVASQVDEANTSDSDETFVYESNPPEPQRRPRHHSRTPSVTSSHSTVDQPRYARNYGDMMDERRLAGKRSMKFSNNPYNDVDSPDSHNGTVRSHQARHFGKFGRGGNHTSMFDQDSPFTQASKLRSNHFSTRHSRPNSPRSPQSLQQQQQQRPSGLFGRKQEQSFDFDGEGADDERTPLVGTVRTARGTRHSSRRVGSGSVRSIDEYYDTHHSRFQRSRWSRYGGCMLGCCVVVAVILSAVAFLIMSNRPMYDVRVHKVQNVLASEQEIMLDLLVGAVNPNALGIQVGEMDVNVFAKSRHVGSSANYVGWERSGSIPTGETQPLDRRRRRRMEDEQPAAKDGNPNPWQDIGGHWHAPSDGDHDHGTNPMPPDDDDDSNLGGDAQTMLLGRIFHFDQALSFEGSPLKRHPHYSVGEVRLLKPGNKTETGGSARWNNVLQHPFELIVRGVLKYQLPVSMRSESVSIAASVVVHPEDGVDKAGNMRIEPVSQKEHWQWIDRPEDVEDEWPDEERVVVVVAVEGR